MCAVAVAVLSTACGGGGGSSQRVTIDTSRFSFTSTYGREQPAPQIAHVTVTGDVLIVGVPPGTEVPDWVAVDIVATRGREFDVSVGIHSNSLLPGVYTLTLRFVTGTGSGADAVWVDVPLSYTVTADLVVTPDALSLAANAGTLEEKELSASQNPGGAVAWTATADPGLHLAASAGGASDPVKVSFDAMAQALDAGVHTLTVYVTATIDGATLTRAVPVTVDVSEHRIHAVRDGYALTSVPGVSKLGDVVTVVDSAGVDTGTWTADADQPWLVVDGIQDDQMAFHADPTGLTAGLHLGTLAIRSTGALVSAPALVRVGLYVSDSEPIQGQLDSSIAAGWWTLLADPIRPWAWRLTRDHAHAIAHNVYSGALEADVSFDPPVASIVLSTDGSILYGGGKFSGTGSITAVQRVNLLTGQPLASIAGSDSSLAAFIRPSGHGLLVDQGGTFRDAATGMPLTVVGGYFYWYGFDYVPSADQRYLFAASSAFSPDELDRYRMHYGGSSPSLSLEAAGGRGLLNSSGGHPVPAPDGSLVMTTAQRDPDGGFVIFAQSSSNASALEQVGTMVKSPGAPLSVGVGPDGRVALLAGGSLDLFDAIGGSWVRTFTLPAFQQTMGVVALSGDGERALVAVDQDDQYTTVLLLGYPSH